MGIKGGKVFFASFIIVDGFVNKIECSVDFDFMLKLIIVNLS